MYVSAFIKCSFKLKYFLVTRIFVNFLIAKNGHVIQNFSEKYIMQDVQFSALRSSNAGKVSENFKTVGCNRLKT